jgi:hypothetical protein
MKVPGFSADPARSFSDYLDGTCERKTQHIVVVEILASPALNETDCRRQSIPHVFEPNPVIRLHIEPGRFSPRGRGNSG